MEEILRMAEEEVRGAGGERARCIRVRIGELAGVVPEALQFAFNALAPGTVAAGGTMEIQTVRASCRCKDCGRGFAPPDYIFQCPDCGSLDADILGGRELELSQLEVI